MTITAQTLYHGDTVVNGGTLTIAGTLNTPTASVSVATGATLNAASIVADSLTIGGGPFAVAPAPVPEPSTLVLLALAGLALVGAYARRR